MKKFRPITMLVFIFVLLLGSTSIANALPPDPPSSFYGEIHFMAGDGGPSAGDTIDAFLDAETSAVVSATIIDYSGTLVYSIKVPEYANGTDPATVTFEIGGRVVAIANWVSGSNVSLNIHPPKADAGGPYDVAVSETFTLYGSATDWLGSDTFDYAWDLDNDGQYDDSTAQEPTYAFSSTDTYTVGLMVTDSQGGVGFASATVNVSKQSATVTLSNLAQTYDGDPKPVTVTTDPPGLTVNVTYDGSATVPTNAGSYAVVATVNDPLYSGSDSGTLVISPAAASVTLSNLEQVYDGNPKGVSVTTVPSSLSYTVTYDGSAVEPSETGTYAVVATITDNNYVGSNSGTLVIYTTHNITLVPGWNLVSFNLQPYPGTDPADVLASIDGDFDLVYGWDATGAHSGSGNWMIYDNVSATTDTLTAIDENMGLWIHLTAVENQVLSVEGFMPSNTDIDLLTAASGWNLVGFPSSTNVSSSTAFTGMTELSLVYGYDASDVTNLWKLYDPDAPVYVSDLTSIEFGLGYWVYVTADTTWSVAY